MPPSTAIAPAWLDVPADRIQPLHERCAEIAAKMRGVDRGTTAALLSKVRVADGHVAVDCTTAAIAGLLGLPQHADAPAQITLTADVRLTRTGMAMKLVQANGSAVTTAPDRSLIRQLLTARRWWGELRQGEIDITRLAERETVTASYVTRIVQLAFLAPAVVEAMLTGKQRSGVDVGSLTQDMPLPACWREQRQMLLPG